MDRVVIHGSSSSNFSKDDIARGLCTLVPFIIDCSGTKNKYNYYNYVWTIAVIMTML